MRLILFIICAILLPLLAVGLYRGIDGHFWVNLVLLVASLVIWPIGFLTVIHALLVVLATSETGALR